MPVHTNRYSLASHAHLKYPPHPAAPTPHSNESSRRRQEPWEQAAHAVMRKLMRRKNAWPFLEESERAREGEGKRER